MRAQWQAWTHPTAALLLAGALAGAGCDRPNPPAGGGTDSASATGTQAGTALAGRLDCPEHTGLRYLRTGPGVAAGGQVVVLDALAVPGMISNVPEFHDCQQFITEAGNAYGPLVAIYASEKLDSLWSPQQPPQVPTRAMALIFNFGEAYAPLRLGPKFSCLYILPGGPQRFTAYIRGVGENEALCNQSFDPTTIPVDSQLAVSRKSRSPRKQDYPPVARWDWDSIRRQQYIGITCGAAWCSVSSAGLNESPDYDDNSPPMTDEKKILRIKGWYDEQRLAVYTGSGLRPEDALGTIIPDARLNTRNDTLDFDKKWIPVARTAFSGFPPNYPYTSKFGFTSATMAAGRFNKVDLCHGSAADCLKQAPIPSQCTDGPYKWWARISPAAPGSDPVYRCVERHGHETLNIPLIPATARWRWLANDETLWVRCAQGCCTVTGEE